MQEISLRQYLGYNEQEIVELYRSVEWANYVNNPVMLENAYKNSLFALGVYVGGDLAGIIRVVGDGSSIIYIQDIIVHPRYQRKGIGSRLLKEILEKYKDVYQKVLLTENEQRTVEFYKSMGFIPANEIGCLSFLNITY